MSLPLFIINLRRSVERRERIASALASLALTAEFVDAVDGSALAGGPPPAVHRPHMGRALTAGELGCLESHVAVLQRVVAAGWPMACVCEDDVRFSDDCAEVLRALASAGAERRGPAWDVLLLGHHSARRAPDAGAITGLGGFRLTDRRRMARVVEFAMGAYGYVVTRRGAERLLAFARPYRMPMDWVTGYSPAAGVRLLAVTPPCVTPHRSLSAASTIEGRGAGPPRPLRLRDRLRAAAGSGWLAARMLGLWPDSYVRRF